MHGGAWWKKWWWGTKLTFHQIQLINVEIWFVALHRIWSQILEECSTHIQENLGGPPTATQQIGSHSLCQYQKENIFHIQQGNTSELTDVPHCRGNPPPLGWRWWWLCADGMVWMFHMTVISFHRSLRRPEQLLYTLCWVTPFILGSDVGGHVIHPKWSTFHPTSCGPSGCFLPVLLVVILRLVCNPAWHH